MGLVLIVEDECLLARNIKKFLATEGHDVEAVDSVTAARRRFKEIHPDVILLDHNLPDGTGLSLLKEVRTADPWTKLVMMTAHGGVDLAVTAMKSGADDYLTKPIKLEEVALLVRKMLAQSRLEGSAAYFRSRQKERSGLDRILGDSPAITAMKQRIQSLTEAEGQPDMSRGPGPSVLILGETGTGKELVARALHFDGPRAAQPFVSINCAALPEPLVEAELFGHERGAFTGAVDKKVGLFQAADGGTLFLDEIGELPLPQQAKLLRAIEDRVIRPLGSLRDRPVDVRLIAATNAAIEERSRQGEFRSDLLYRLNAFVIEVPPLRKRGEDIIALAECFIVEFQHQYARSPLSLSPDARAALLRHSWPGNIRELRNVIEQASLLCANDCIREADLNLRDVPPLKLGNAAAPELTGLADAERALIVEALRQSRGNVTSAARKLGVSRDTLRYRIEKFALDRDDYV